MTTSNWNHVILMISNEFYLKIIKNSVVTRQSKNFSLCPTDARTASPTDFLPPRSSDPRYELTTTARTTVSIFAELGRRIPHPPILSMTGVDTLKFLLSRLRVLLGASNLITWGSDVKAGLCS